MKRLILLTYLNLWSMEKGKGAPSFFKTVDAYVNDGWDIILINPDYGVGVTPEMKGVVNYTFKPIFFPLTKIKGLSFFGRILHALHGNLVLFKIAQKLIQNSKENTCLYAYEVHATKAARKLADKYDLPLVTRFQGTVLHPIKNTFINRLKKYPHFGALSTKADITIMTDDGTHGDRVLKNLGNQSNTVKFWRNGVDIARNHVEDVSKSREIRRKCNLREEDRVLLTVSRLASWKRLDRAINAMPSLIKIDSRIHLVIVGDGAEKDKFMDLANQLGVKEHVFFVGAVEQSEVVDYMAIADIFLSLYDLSNVGNPLLEAMSCGKPIVTLDVGDTSSLIIDGKTGVLLNAEHLDTLPERIIQLIEDKKYAEELGANAREFADNEFWSWKDRMDAEISIVNTLYKEYFGDLAETETNP